MLIETSAARDLGRLNEIAGVLIRHGLATWCAAPAWPMRWSARATLHCERAADLAARPEPPPARLAMEELGARPSSSGHRSSPGRADLFGPDWIAEFASRTAACHPCAGDDLLPQLREDPGRRARGVFARFDAEPLAAARPSPRCTARSCRTAPR